MSKASAPTARRQNDGMVKYVTRFIVTRIHCRNLTSLTATLRPLRQSKNWRVFEAIVDSSFADTLAVAGLFPTNHKQPVWGIVVVWMGVDRADPPPISLREREGSQKQKQPRRHVFWLIVPLSELERGQGMRANRCSHADFSPNPVPQARERAAATC